jgi:hypothetical protein
MATRSKQGALAMSLAATLPFTLTSALLNLLVPYLVSGDIHSVVANPENLDQPAEWLLLAVVLAALLAALTACAAYWIYKYFGEAYYGRRSAWRWALFGVFLAALIKLPDWLLPGSVAILRYAWFALCPFLAFFLSRWLIPVRK